MRLIASGVTLPINNSEREMLKAEYILLGVMLLAAGLAFPAFRDVQLVQDIFTSFCSGLGIL